MSIINALNQQKGVNFFDTQLQPGLNAVGRSAMVRIGNKLMLVYAENTPDNLERRLRFSFSLDSGTTWASPVDLTTGGYWDDEPALVLLSQTDPATNIGLVFMRAENYSGYNTADFRLMGYRVTLDQFGTLTSPIDPLPPTCGSLTGGSSLNVVPLGNGFAINYMQGFLGGGGPVPTFGVGTIYNSVDFTSNNWKYYVHDGGNFNSYTYALPLVGPQTLRFKVKQLANGDYMLVAAYVTAHDGVKTQFTYEGNYRTDVVVSVSQDNMQSWSPLQNLTNNTFIPSVSLTPNRAPVDVDFVQLSDGSISIMFVEMPLPTIWNDETTPVFPPHYNWTEMIYHPNQKAMIAVTGGFNSSGPTGQGFFVIPFNGATPRRIYSASPSNLAIWDDQTIHLALSPDNKYLAVSSDTAALEVFDTTDPEPNNWVHTLTLRGTSTPALHSRISQIKFLDNTTLFMGWSNSGVGRCFGSTLDVEAPQDGLVDILVPQGDSLQGVSDGANIYQQIVGGQRILFFTTLQGSIYKINLDNDHNRYSNTTTGPPQYVGDTYPGYDFTAQLFYDDVNDEWLINCVNQFHGNRYVITSKDRGNYFSFGNLLIDQSLWTFQVKSIIPGSGAILTCNKKDQSASWHGAGEAFYSFKTKQIWFNFGTINENNIQSSFAQQYIWGGIQSPSNPVIPMTKGGPTSNLILNETVYLTQNGLGFNLQFFFLQNLGRLRQGAFAYDPATRQLLTSGVNFYDAVNGLKTGPQMQSVTRFCQAAMADDELVVAGSMLNFQNPVQPSGQFVAPISSAALKLQTKARIKNTIPRALGAKVHIAGLGRATFGVQAHMVKAACFRAQARVSPRSAETFTAKATVLNRQQVHCPVTFTIDSAQRQVVRAFFFADTGYNTSVLFGMRAFIVRRARKRVTAHFIVPALRRIGSLTVSLNRTQVYPFGSRARIEVS